MAVLLPFLILGGMLLAFLVGYDQPGKKFVDSRVVTERVFEGYNLKFNKEIGQTSIILNIEPTDSIKIQCNDCAANMSLGEEKGTLNISLNSIDGAMEMAPGYFNRWIKFKTSNGKVGIVFERDGLGEKILMIRSIVVWRKTKKPQRDIAGVPVSLVDINNLYIDKLAKEGTEDQTTFFFKLKSEDMVNVTIKGANGAIPENLICSEYKDGEEFDKTPIAAGAPFPVPTVDGGSDRFGFEFSHIKDVKGINAYFIDIERIPKYTTGHLDVVEEPVDSDTIAMQLDTLKEEDPFLKYLEMLKGAPDFQCVTPEGEYRANILGKLNLGFGKTNKLCFDIPLTDECVASEECIGCDSLWAFWIGVGDDIINKYMYLDSTRKLSAGEGLVESYARSTHFRGMQGTGLFPVNFQGEDIFFTIIDQFEKDRFMNSEIRENDFNWYGDNIYTFSPGNYANSGSFILKYNVARPLSLCMCNNNSVTSVPVLFKFQQFLTEPKKKDTLATNTNDMMFEEMMAPE